MAIVGKFMLVGVLLGGSLVVASPGCVILGIVGGSLLALVFLS